VSVEQPVPPSPTRNDPPPPASVARRFEAIIFDPGRPSEASDGHAEVARLRDLGAAASAVTITLAFLADTPPGDLDSWLSDLWRIGIGPAEVLVVRPEPGKLPAGVAWVSGGLQMLAAVLEDQLARRRDGELPRIARDPAWTLTVTDGDPAGRRVPEGLLTLADGSLGTRGSVLVANAEDDPAVLMAGVYSGQGPQTRLLDGPSWNTLAIHAQAGLSAERVLNLRAGTLTHELVGGAAQLQALLLSSLARPATTVLRVHGSGVTLLDKDGLEAPAGAEHQRGASGDCSWIRVTGAPGSILAARHTRVVAAPHRAEAQHWLLDRMTSYESRSGGATDGQEALDAVAVAADLGFDALFDEHRRAWANRWDDADIDIDGDPDLQLTVRLALFHLMASVTDHGEAAVGARGMSGPGYRGHVFWDSDVYVLPFLAATHPASARAMLEYRVRRLPASLAAARAEGLSGARFAWESAASGQDVTPLTAPNGRGGNDPVYSGQQEEHVVADVAWAAAHYIDWTGDEAFATGPGLELLVQTARWWASRIQRDDDGSAHIRDVMGPDEYHEHVDDDAYTNLMARWNLRRAAGATANGSVDPHERSHWLALADAIVDGYDPVTGIYEQFAGFNALEPLVIADLAARRPVSADMLLGHARVRAAQIVKQPDVLMAHYLIPEELALGSLRPNLDFYDPRTAHGSSLSPGVHAALMARAGYLEHALELLRLTTRIDLDDIGGEAEEGVHLAAMGSVWRAIALGFAGLRPAGDALAIDPVLPPGWESLKLSVSFRGSRIRVCVLPDCVQASANPPAAALTPAGERVMLGRNAQSFAHAPALVRSR
jgi:trehalose/maltose hydrolase-like predicted phosphorylase